MRIYLLGYMYSGKSTIGRQLAKRLGYRFMDTDQAIEEKYRLSIPLFFNRYGEQAFRIVEQKMLFGTADLEDTVIALGGGTPCNEENSAFVRQNGCSIYLKMSAEKIIERMIRSRKQRPLLADKSEAERKAHVVAQLAEREAYYSQATLTVDAGTGNAEEIAARIVGQLEATSR